ncbi:SDR family oxidoreductase [Lacrimispora sp.]|jgi:enoyl-[acyl-carrier protein] reductase III|uniref:SDR family oxidoreductase n=1 Tax=Lacrimispora sp. TaxID=2719234 RepID=UPI0028A70AC4|nr:SDR family oxidoreductase [Lacrimispora sp.]
MEKIALVTGSSRGIGKVIAEKLLLEGYTVYLHYCMNEELAKNTYEEFLNRKFKTRLICSDISNEDEIKKMFEKIKEESGYIDVLINNAASGVHKSIVDIRKRDWDFTFEVNARGTFLCSKYAVPLMKASTSLYKSIVNITSTGSQRYIPGYSLIGGTKAYIENLTKYMACELSSYGINVNAVSGGLVETDSLNYFQDKKLVMEEFKKRVPAGRLVMPEDIANLVSFLCNSNSEMIRGQTIVVDGGASLI